MLKQIDIRKHVLQFFKKPLAMYAHDTKTDPNSLPSTAHPLSLLAWFNIYFQKNGRSGSSRFGNLHLQSANVQCFLLLHSPIFSGRRHFTVADPSLCSCAPLLLCYFELHKTRNPLTRVTRSSWCNGLGKVNIEKVVFRGNKSATSVKNLQQISSLHGFQSSWFNLSWVQVILLADIPTWWCSAAKHS